MNISGKTTLYGVIGFPIKHSLSPIFQNRILWYVGLDAVYVPFEVKPEDLKTALEGLKALGVKGVNITIPHKERILEFLDFVDDHAKGIGAVNTVRFGDKTEGYNTDWVGFLKSLREISPELKGKKALVLGAGGSARAVLYALKQEDVQVFLWNRTKDRAKILSQSFGVQVVDFPEEVVSTVDLIINTTSVGLTEEGMLFDYSLIGEGQVVFELLYNKDTLLKEWAKKKGAKYSDGLRMLLYQGIESFKLWTGCEPNAKVALKALFEHLKPTL